MIEVAESPAFTGLPFLVFMFILEPYVLDINTFGGVTQMRGFQVRRNVVNFAVQHEHCPV